MSEWMWFVAIILGMILSAACTVKWIDARVKIEKILREELGDNDVQDNSEDR